jgi:predicted O-methyltransferase YrrM
MISKAPNTAHFVEVGSWLGRSASFMAVEIMNSGKDIKLDCVDLWEFDPEGDVDESLFIRAKNPAELFLRNMKKSNVENLVNPLKMSSVTASKLYEDNSLDFVFIDANHEYHHIKEDIEAWYPKVKTGGYIGGHDYGNYESVTQAVQEAFKNDILISRISWLHLKK